MPYSATTGGTVFSLNTIIAVNGSVSNSGKTFVVYNNSYPRRYKNINIETIKCKDVRTPAGGYLKKDITYTITGSNPDCSVVIHYWGVGRTIVVYEFTLTNGETWYSPNNASGFCGLITATGTYEFY